MTKKFILAQSRNGRYVLLFVIFNWKDRLLVVCLEIGVIQISFSLAQSRKERNVMLFVILNWMDRYFCLGDLDQRGHNR